MQVSLAGVHVQTRAEFERLSQATLRLQRQFAIYVGQLQGGAPTKGDKTPATDQMFESGFRKMLYLCKHDFEDGEASVLVLGV